MKKKYYVLGVGFKSTDQEMSHPYEIWLDMQEKNFPIVMLEGRAVNGVGGSFKPNEILDEQWSEHIKLSDSEWLIPLLESSAKTGNCLDPEAVIDRYVEVKGKEPELKEF